MTPRVLPEDKMIHFITRHDGNAQYNDVTNQPGCPKAQATQLFVQQFLSLTTKETSKTHLTGVL